MGMTATQFEQAVNKSTINKPLSEVTLLQIGANDGKQSDPVNAFIKRTNCNAHLCEPVPEYFESLQNNYAGCSKVHFHNVAISTNNGVEKISYVPNSSDLPAWTRGLGTFDIMRNYLGEGRGNFQGKDDYSQTDLYKTVKERIVEIDVEVNTLETFLSKNNITTIDILVTDTEGWDNIIFQQLDLENFKPFVIVMESHYLPDSENEEMDNKLEKYGYTFTKGWDTIATK